MEQFVDPGTVKLKRSRKVTETRGRARILSIARFPDPTFGLYATRFSPDGKMIAVACGSGGIQLRDGETGDLLETLRGGLPQALPIMCARFGPRPQRDAKKDTKGARKIPETAQRNIAASDSDSDSDSESPIIATPSKATPNQLTKKIQSAPDSQSPEKLPKFRQKGSGVFYAGSACGRIFKCILREGLCETFAIEEGNEVHALDVDITSTVLATGGKDAVLRFYDLQTSKLIHKYEKPFEGDYKGHTARIYSIRYDPGEKSILFTGGWDDIVKVWDIRTPDGVAHNLYGPHICGGDAIDVKGVFLVTGSWSVNNAIKVWDIRELKVVDHVNPQNRPPSLDGEFVYAAQFFEGDPTLDILLIGGSGTGAMEIISRKENKVIERFATEKAILSIDTYGPVITYGGMNNTMYIGEFT